MTKDGAYSHKRLNPKSIRKQVLYRDRGVCARCGLDTIELRQRLDDMLYDIAPTKNPPSIVMARRVAYEEELAKYGLTWGHEEHLWEAHHREAVIEGGIERSIENAETLCVVCHRAESKALAHRLKLRRQEEGNAP
jgi:5-methylcytosine-specific restriction endonuclease McrA